jgi:hypothetical protein
MNSSSSASNYPVPEDSSADGRDDADGSSEEIATPPAVVLPPRRSANEQPDSRSAQADNVGLRIEPNIKRGKTSKSSRLQVQEIHSGVVRLDQATPNPPKPPRQVPFQKRPSRDKNSKKSHGEGAGWGLGNHHPTLWILGSGAAVIAIVICAMILLPSLNAPNAPRPGTQAKAVVLNENKDAENLRGLLAKQSEARQIFQSYITASHVDEIVPLVRDGATMTALLGKNWQPSPIPKSWAPAASSSWAVAEHDGYAFGILQGALPDGSTFTAYFSHKSDRLQLDWKATTAYGSATFSEMAKNQGNTAEIRGEISEADFYTAAWPEADYQSYRLLSADGESFIWCYARRGSAADESIAPHFRKSGINGEARNSRKITLQLERGPEGAQPNQWLIGEMLHFDWVTP